MANWLTNLFGIGAKPAVNVAQAKPSAPKLNIHDLMGALSNQASRGFDQVNPFDNGLSYQTRQVHAPPQSVARQATNLAQPVVNMTGAPAVVDTARALTSDTAKQMAILTHNRQAYLNAQAANQAAQNRLAANVPQALPISLANGAVPLARSVATAVLSPYAEHVANQQADYARRMLNNNTSNHAHNAAVEAYANQIKQNALAQQLAQNGVNVNDTTGQVTRKVAGQGVDAATSIAFAGQLPGIGAAKTLAGAAKTAATYGGLNAASAAGQVAQMNDPTRQDYTHAVVPAALSGTALPLALHGAGVAVPAAARAAAPAIDRTIEANRALAKGDYRGTLGGSEATGYKAAKAKGQVFDGVDGKPRFEVDDSKATTRPMTKENIGKAADFLKSEGSGGSTTLGKVLDHPQLFKDYPELANLPVSFTKSASKEASYSGGAIWAKVDPKTNKIDKDTLLHEVQHAIQDREGFASGGSPVSVDSRQIALIDQNINENMNGLARIKDPATRKRVLSEIDRLQKLKSEAETQPMRDYANLAGEAEARAVAARADMPMSERYQPKSTFYDSLDVPKKDLIINKGGGTAASAKDSGVMMSMDNPEQTAAQATLKTMTSSLDAQKYATFDSFYKDFKAFFDDNNINQAQAQTIYDKAQHAPVAISKSGTGRTAAELQAQIEAAHNAGDTALEAKLNAQLPDPAMSSTPAAMTPERRAELMAKMQGNLPPPPEPHNPFALDQRGAIPVTEPTPSAVSQLIDQQTKLQEQARNAGKATGVKGKLIALKNEAKVKLLDSFSPIEDKLNQAVKDGATITPEQNIKYQIDRAIRAETIGAQYIKDNGLAKIIQDVPNTKEFDQYLIARHAADLTRNGITTGRDAAIDQQIVSALAPKYEPYAQAINQYSQRLLDTAVSYGLISKELATQLKAKYPNYVPVNRIFSEDELTRVKGLGGGKASISQQTVIQRIKGSERQIESPLSSLIDKSIKVVQEGERNKAATILASYKKLPGNPFNLRELSRDETVGSKPVISVLDKGVTRRFETTPEVAAAAKALNKEQLGLVGQILAVPTRVLRLGATGLNPAFALANVTKDTVSAFINSKHPLRSSVANPQVFLQALKAATNHNSAEYGELVREGAGGTSFDIARNAPVQNVRSIRLQKNSASKALYTVTTPSQLFRAVENAIGRSEEFNRAIQYFGNKQAAIKLGNKESTARIIGADAARNNTVNFARAGDYGRVVNSVLPYLNAGVQGSRTLLRNLKDRPVQTGAKLVLTAFFPTAVVTAWNLGDPKRKEAYDDIKQYEKQNNIIIVPPHPKKDASGRWNVIKIPVSQEIANLNDNVRMGVESMMHDGSINVGQLIGNTIGTATSLNAQSPRQLVGQLTPQAIKPEIETLVNQNLFTGNKIVPDSQKNLQPKDQYGDYTSGTAKVVGRTFGVSPRHVDNFIRTAGGGLSQNIINWTDSGLAKAGVIKPNEVQGKSVPDAVSGRFYGAQGQSPYDIAATKNTDLSKQLQKLPGYQSMSPADKAKALNRLQSEVNKVYVPPKDGSTPKLSDRQQKLKDGKPDLASYLVNQNATKTPAPPKNPHPTPSSIKTTYDPKAKTWTQVSSKTGRTVVITEDGTRTVTVPGVKAPRAKKVKVTTSGGATTKRATAKVATIKFKAPKLPRSASIGLRKAPSYHAPKAKSFAVHKLRIAKPKKLTLA